MATPAIHTLPAGDDGWAVTREGSHQPVSTHTTKADAERAGRELARAERAEHVIHNADGAIGERNSYGNDPVSRPG